jgi:hypothetical protein
LVRQTDSTRSISLGALSGSLRMVCAEVTWEKILKGML